MSTPNTKTRGHWSPLGMVTAVVSLAALIYALQGQSLAYGLFMDDHAHFRQLQQCDWSLAGLTGACRLELVGGTIELWWLPETTLRFFRPVTFGLMKLTYTLTGWSPEAMHASSLLWHLAACSLLMVLLRRLGASGWLAWAVAVLFAIHPGDLATVQWIACQTELMVTTFLLGATLCFGRFRGWPGFTPDRIDTAGVPATASVGWAVLSAGFFALALGCRENAVMFPFVVAAAEPLVWRQRKRAALGLYALFAALLVAYLVTRRSLLGGVSVPPRPYVVPPTDPDFLRYIFDKALYYLLGQYLLIPCVPIGGLAYFEARPFLFYGLSAGVVALSVAVWVWNRRQLSGLLGPAWLVGFMVPVLPVFASPHHLYLPGVGWAVTAMLILRAIGTPRPDAGPRLARWRRGAMWTAVVLAGGLFGTTSYYFGLAFETGQRVEDCLTAEVAAAPSGLQDGDVLYTANLPVIGHYLRLAVEERTGRQHLRVIPLTWSPRLLGPTTPTELTWIDDRTIEIRIAGDRYFSGALGMLIRAATGRDIPDEVDRTADLGFRVRVLQRDAAGIAALRYEFVRPLSDPRLHLFWASRTRWAYEVRP